MKIAKETNKRSIDAILSIKILDNAMGTGHFLVEATEYLALKLYEAIQDDMKSGKILETETASLSWAKKEILFHCMYGVDLDEFAVEVAKIALWLTAGDKKLTLKFFNNNIKHGNSLIGTIFDESDKIHKKLQKMENPEIFKEGIDSERFKIIADMNTVILYGNLIKFDKYLNLSSKLMKCSKEALPKLINNDLIRRIKKFAKKNMFFHWQLEFPDVFFRTDKLGIPRMGFDVIIGNPPWASIRGKHSADLFNDMDITYLAKKFQGNTYMPNAYEYFILQSLKLLNKNGRHSYIIPDRLGFNESLEYLRKIIINDYTLNSLTYKIPFPGVIADTLIYSISKTKSLNNYFIKVKEFGGEMVEIERSHYQNAESTTFQFYKNRGIYDVFKIIDATETIKLKNIAETAGGFGGKSELITKTQINEQQIEIIKGINVGRYFICGKYYFVFKKDNITGRTTDKRKLGARPKVLLRKTGDVIYSAYDNTGIYPEQSLYFLYNFKGEYSPFYLLSILNSSLFKFYYIEKLVTNRDTTPHLKKIHLDHFPFKRVRFTTKKNEKDNILISLKNIYKLYLQNGVVTEFNDVINNCLTEDVSSSKIIEKCDVIHDFLAYLGQQMTKFNEIKLKSKDVVKKINYTDDLIDYLIFKIYYFKSDITEAIMKALKTRGL
jgi:hypothetical protein